MSEATCEKLADNRPWISLRSSGLRALRRSQHGSLHRLWQRDRSEKTLRIEIVLPGLINDPKQAELFGRSVAQRNVDFPLLQRGRVALVADADDELSCPAFCRRATFKAGAPHGRPRLFH